MKTENDSQTTEADVIAFLRAQAQDLAAKTGVGYASVRVDVNARLDYAPEWSCYVDGGTHEEGDTLAAAVATQCTAMVPKNRASRLRSEAAKLLAEAGGLEKPEASP